VQADNVRILLVDYLLPTIAVPPELPVVAFGEVRAGIVMRLLAYRPVTFLPVPVTVAIAGFAIAQALGMEASLASQPAAALNTWRLLQDFVARLNTLRRDPTASRTLGDSLRYHCRTTCPFARTGEQIAGHENEYRILELLTARGTIYCDRESDCPVWKFHEQLAASDPELLPVSIATMLDAPPPDSGQTLTEHADLLLARKHRYCTSACPKLQHGPDFTPGDQIFSSYAEVLAGTAAWCNDRHCPLDAYFELLRTNGS